MCGCGYIFVCVCICLGLLLWMRQGTGLCEPNLHLCGWAYMGMWAISLTIGMPDHYSGRCERPAQGVQQLAECVGPACCGSVQQLVQFIDRSLSAWGSMGADVKRSLPGVTGQRRGHPDDSIRHNVCCRRVPAGQACGPATGRWVVGGLGRVESLFLNPCCE